MIIEQTQTTRSIYFGRLKPIPIFAAVSWLLLIITGTDLVNATLLTIAIVFGLMSVGVAGGIKTAPGLLNFIMILKFVLIAMVLKAVTLQAVDSNLRAPRTTCKVMAVGFFALYLGSLIYRRLTKIRGVVRDVLDSRVYLALVIVFSVFCIGSAFLLVRAEVSASESLSGGIWGIVHQFIGGASFCVVPAMYYAWSSGSKRFLSHPLVLIVLGLELAIGIISTTKQGAMEPILCYLSVGAIRYGLRSKALWGIVTAGILFYMFLVYPYSQYVRDHGGREGSLQERIQVIKDVFFSVSTDSDYREMVETQITKGDTYLNRDGLRSVSRLAMIGEADKLIAATDSTQSYTGWDTIINGFKLMVPSFLMPDKPLSGGGNLLGHIVGELADNDYTTQVSYGFMANLYNAFGLTGVLIGTVLFIACFYYVVRLWFAAPNLNFSPWGSSIWYVLIGALFEHSLIEGPIGNMLPTLIYLSVYVLLALLANWLFSLFKYKAAPIRY